MGEAHRNKEPKCQSPGGAEYNFPGLLLSNSFSEGTPLEQSQFTPMGLKAGSCIPHLMQEGGFVYRESPISTFSR